MHSPIPLGPVAVLFTGLVSWGISAATAADIVFISGDHQVYVVDPDGGEPKALTRGDEPGRMTALRLYRRTAARPIESAPGDAMRFSMPAWSPDGSSLLVHGTKTRGEAVIGPSGVYRVDPERPGIVTPVHVEKRRSPIYSLWNPTSSRAAILLGERAGLTLGVVEIGTVGIREIGKGRPHYFAWSGDGRKLAIHVGGSSRANASARLWLRDLGKDEGTATSERPAGFRSPGWDPSGERFVYAAFPEQVGGAHIYVARPDGADPLDLGPVGSPLILCWAPTEPVIAFAEALPMGGLFSGIQLVHATDGRREPLYAGAVGAFFWSPDGSRILVAAPDFESGDFRWLVVDRESTDVKEVARFHPSPDLQAMFLHFDQYAMSHRFWAPDSKQFTFASFPVRSDGRVPLRSEVRVIDVEQMTDRVITDGRSAFWAPR